MFQRLLRPAECFRGWPCQQPNALTTMPSVLMQGAIALLHLNIIFYQYWMLGFRHCLAGSKS